LTSDESLTLSKGLTSRNNN